MYNLSVSLLNTYKSRFCVLNDKNTQERLRVSFHLEAQVFARTQPGTTRRPHQESDAQKIRPLSEKERMVDS